MPDLWSDLLACLELGPLASPDGNEAAGATFFEGRNQALQYHRVFGGQLLAQFIQIASATCPAKTVKSQHAVFAKEGRADEPIRYAATRQHEGRSFATVTITARQNRGVIATSSICMHVSEDGPQHQEVPDVPAVLGPEHRLSLDLIPWDTRTTVDLNTTTTGPSQFEFWMRTPSVYPGLAPALAAYATDLTLIGTALRPIDGASPRGNGSTFTSAVTSHTIWFTGRSEPTSGCCCASTAPCSRTAAALAAATCSPKTASWSRHMPRKRFSASRDETSLPRSTTRTMFF